MRDTYFVVNESTKEDVSTHRVWKRAMEAARKRGKGHYVRSIEYIGEQCITRAWDIDGKEIAYTIR